MLRQMLILFACSIYCLAAPPTATWQSQWAAPKSYTHTCKTFGKSDKDAFPVSVQLELNPQLAKLSLTFDQIQNFKHLNLKALASDETPMPGRKALRVSNSTHNEIFEFDVFGEYLDTSSSQIPDQYELIVSGNPSTPTCKLPALFRAIEKNHKGWAIGVKHEGKQITILIDFPSHPKQQQ